MRLKSYITYTFADGSGRRTYRVRYCAGVAGRFTGAAHTSITGGWRKEIKGQLRFIVYVALPIVLLVIQNRGRRAENIGQTPRCATPMAKRRHWPPCCGARRGPSKNREFRQNVCRSDPTHTDWDVQLLSKWLVQFLRQVFMCLKAKMEKAKKSVNLRPYGSNKMLAIRRTNCDADKLAKNWS